MKRYLLLGLLIQVVANPAYGMENKKTKPIDIKKFPLYNLKLPGICASITKFQKYKPKNIKPLGIKNYPLLDLKLQGLCSYIAKFQVLNAGFHALNSETYSGNGDNNAVWKLTQKYKKQQTEQADTSFVFTPSEIAEVYDEKGLPVHFDKYYPWYTWNYSEHTWNDQSRRKPVIKRKNLIYNKPEELDLFLQKKLKKYSSTTQKPLVIINLDHDQETKNLANAETIQELQKIKIPKFQSTYENYQLVGVVQQQNYALKNKKLYLGAVLLERLLYNKMSSARFKYNPKWNTHFDAYVKYNNTWYVMDDETRWKVSTNLTNKSECPDVVAEALIHCYPGLPQILIYAPTEGLIRNSEILNPELYSSLVLQRDTKQPSLLKSGLVLLGGALWDGTLAGSYVLLISNIVDALFYPNHSPENTLKDASIVGLIIGGISFAYHGNRILSMHKSQITYTSQSPRTELGPRGK